MVHRGGGNKIGRITTAGVITEFPVRRRANPTGSAGPDGALWFMEYAGNKIGRITTAGNVTANSRCPRPEPTQGITRVRTAHSGSPSKWQQDRADYDHGGHSPNTWSPPPGAPRHHDRPGRRAVVHRHFWKLHRAGAGAIAARTHDFNGDGYSDIAWRDNSGDLALWLMNGATVLSSGGVGGVPTTWSIVGQRDFNGDGMADLLWRDTSGNTAIWFMDGTSVASSVSVGNIPTNWSVVGVADFNGDGLGDLLWRDSTGDLAVWLMSGATVMSSVGLGNVPTTWTVVGTGDFNGDGRPTSCGRTISATPRSGS